MHCVQVLLVAAGLGKLRQEVQLVGRFAARQCWLHALMFLQQLLQRCSIFFLLRDEAHQDPDGVLVGILNLVDGAGTAGAVLVLLVCGAVVALLLQQVAHQDAQQPHGTEHGHDGQHSRLRRCRLLWLKLPCPIGPRWSPSCHHTPGSPSGCSEVWICTSQGAVGCSGAGQTPTLGLPMAIRAVKPVHAGARCVPCRGRARGTGAAALCCAARPNGFLSRWASQQLAGGGPHAGAAQHPQDSEEPPAHPHALQTPGPPMGTWHKETASLHPNSCSGDSKGFYVWGPKSPHRGTWGVIHEHTLCKGAVSWKTAP